MVPSDSDTEELLRQAADGSSEACGTLLERYRQRLERMVQVRMDRRLSARIDAADVVQDTLRPALDAFGPVAFSADGRTMAVACRDGMVPILDTTSWNLQSQLNAHNSMVRAIALSRDGRFAATSAEDRTLRLWDARRGRPEALGTWTAVGDYLAFSPDGVLLAVAGRDGSVSLRRRNDGGEQALFRLPAAPSALAFSPSGSTLAAATVSALVLWDVSAGKERARCGRLGPRPSRRFPAPRRRPGTGRRAGSRRRWGPL